MIALAPISRAASTGLHQVVGHGDVDRRDPRDVDDHDLRAAGLDRGQQLLQLPCPLRVEHADDRQDQQPLLHLEHRGGKLVDRFLLLADDPLAPSTKLTPTVTAMRFAAGS